MTTIIESSVPDAPLDLTRIAVAWGTIVSFFVPIGYQDENGFHFGSQLVLERPVRLESNASIGH